MIGRYWTEEEEEVLRRGVADGLTNRDIARKLGRPFNSIAGKINRMGLQSDERRQRWGPGFQNAYRKKAMSRAFKKSVTVERKTRANFDTSKRIAVERMARPSDGVMIHRTCQYPVGDPRDAGFHFCGKKIKPDGRPYCAIHHALCVQPLDKSRLAKVI